MFDFKKSPSQYVVSLQGKTKTEKKNLHIHSFHIFQNSSVPVIRGSQWLLQAEE
jgi:hypothetical protein